MKQSLHFSRNVLYLRILFDKNKIKQIKNKILELHHGLVHLAQITRTYSNLIGI